MENPLLLATKVTELNPCVWKKVPFVRIQYQRNDFFNMDKADKRRFNNNLPELVKRLNPKEILPYLACLSGPSREVIINRQNNESTLAAMLALHEHLLRCVNGFQEFVTGLRELGLNDIADRLTQGKDGENKPEELFKTKESRKQQTYNYDTFVRDINVGFLDNLKHLDYSGEQRWEQLAGHLGYSYRDCNKVANKAKIDARSPTIVLLDDNIDLTLGELLKILKYKMERNDVVEMLENCTGFRLPEIDNQQGDDDWQKDKMSENKDDKIQDKKKSISEMEDRGVEILYNRKDHQKLAINRWSKMSDSQRNENVIRSLGDPMETPYVPLDQPTETCEVTDISSVSLAKQGMHLPTEMVVEEKMYDGVIIEVDKKPNKEYNRDLSLEEDRLHAVETSVTDQDTKLTADMCEISEDGCEPNSVRQMLFHQQECEKPGPYVPVTGSASSSDLSQDKFFQDFSVQSQEASAVVNVAESCDLSLISLGDAYSIHHHTDQIIDDYPDTHNEMLSSNEERADILRKALKPLPTAAGIDFDTQMQHMDEIECEHDRVDDTEPRGNTNSVSDTDSYEIPSSITLPPVVDEKTSQQKMHLGSPLFRRRASGVNPELSDKVSDDANNNDHAVRLSEAVQESVLPVTSARGEIDVDKENRTGESALPVTSARDETDSDTEYRTGAFFVSHGQDQSEVDNQESSFPWMHSLIFVGTAVVALAYKSLKG